MSASDYCHQQHFIALYIIYLFIYLVVYNIVIFFFLLIMCYKISWATLSTSFLFCSKHKIKHRRNYIYIIFYYVQYKWTATNLYVVKNFLPIKKKNMIEMKRKSTTLEYIFNLYFFNRHMAIVDIVHLSKFESKLNSDVLYCFLF